jgi:hypothetical protein
LAESACSNDYISMNANPLEIHESRSVIRLHESTSPISLNRVVSS